MRTSPTSASWPEAAIAGPISANDVTSAPNRFMEASFAGKTVEYCASQRAASAAA
jgi:hypothetical protein